MEVIIMVVKISAINQSNKRVSFKATLLPGQLFVYPGDIVMTKQIASGKTTFLLTSDNSIKDTNGHTHYTMAYFVKMG